MLLGNLNLFDNHKHGTKVATNHISPKTLKNIFKMALLAILWLIQ